MTIWVPLAITVGTVPTITYDGTALADLLTSLDALGLITDSSTAS